ncbi:MAG TPA: RNA-binding domain-containing protein [Methanomassiliicoccales archaeon]|nr:RNA-binding domain-containing protein [Methanomassiliicoccales archaeon]
MSVTHLTLRAFCQATEVEERVRKAMAFASGSEEVSVERTEGYHGNAILIMSCTLSRRPAIREFFQRLSKEDVEELLRTLDQRLDEDGQLFFRLDKQKAFLGELAISSGDDCIHVRAKVESYPKRREKALENARAMLQGLYDRQDK